MNNQMRPRVTNTMHMNPVREESKKVQAINIQNGSHPPPAPLVQYFESPNNIANNVRVNRTKATNMPVQHQTINIPHENTLEQENQPQQK